MSSSFEKYQRRRLRSSYFSVVISIALVLFLVGLFGLVFIKTTHIAQHVKETVTLTIFLKDQARKQDVANLQAELKRAPYTNSIRYISKADAAVSYQEDLGEDFIEFLGENPLKNAIDLTLTSSYVTPEAMAKIEKNLLIRKIVSEVLFDKPLIELLSKNLSRLSFWMLIFSVLLGLVSVVLINSSIRLSVYSKRFTLKTMQLVGATKRFIRRPFIRKSMQLGLIAALIAIAGLAAFAYYIDSKIPELALFSDLKPYGFLALGMLLLGLLITWISTFFATRRFLNLRTDELYY